MDRSVLLHRVRFYVSDLYSINCISYNAKTSKAALLRRRIRKYQPSQNEMHSIIEIWNMENKASFLEQVIYDNSNNLALLEEVVWTKSGRLLSCGLNTYLNEYDLVNGTIVNSYCVNSSPAWCLAIDPLDKLVAVGTENGFICIYKIHPDCLQYEKLMDKHENRILCLEWFYSQDDATSPLLIGGTIDFIKIWKYQSGRCVDFIKVGNTGLVVWCLTVLKDFTIVSGDSNGTTSFWNGKTVTLNCSYKSHKGDVLAVCASPDQKVVFSAGVDPVIVQFKPKAMKSDSWVISTNRRPHSHDIRALACTPNEWLLSGGIDGFFSQTRYPPSLQINHLTNLADHVRLAFKSKHSKYLALKYEKFIQVWKLGEAENDENVSNLLLPHSVSTTKLKLYQNAEKIVEVKSRKAITVFDFNSKWMVYANNDNIKVVLWAEDKVQKVKVLHDPIASVSQICIVDTNRFVVSFGKSFEVFKLEQLGVVSEVCVPTGERISQIAASTKRLIVALADCEHTMLVFDLATCTKLTSFSCPSTPSAIKVNPLGTTLCIAFGHSKLAEYDLKSLNFSKIHSLDKYKSNESSECTSFNEHWPIKQFAFAGDLILFSDDNNLYSLNSSKMQITNCHQYRHTVFMDNCATDSNEIVLVEITPEMLFNLMPPMLNTKSFGT